MENKEKFAEAISISLGQDKFKFIGKLFALNC